MKLFFILLLITVLIVGVYLYWQSRSAKPVSIAGSDIALYGDNTPIEYTGTDEFQNQFIQSKVNRSKGDLRTLSVALESYKVDFNVYPGDLFKLSTPIAYIIMIPKDPFTQSSYMKYVNKGDEYLIWSIGPDLKNNNGTSHYDPNQGNKSSGDILRTAKE